MRDHDFNAAHFTGTVTCSTCGLLPLDQDDLETPCLPETIQVIGRRWFQATYGNTYHTAEVIVTYSKARTGEGIETEEFLMVPFQYGYGDQYIESAHEELRKEGLLPELVRYANGGIKTLRVVCEDLGIELTTSVTDGLKRELHTSESGRVL